MRISDEKNAILFKAFCDSNRLLILELLYDGEKCACKLLEEMKISQSTLSHHMKILCDSGVVRSRKDGKWTYYTIERQGCLPAKEFVETLMEAKQEACSC